MKDKAGGTVKEEDEGQKGGEVEEGRWKEHLRERKKRTGRVEV